uniref:Uncharacterized protein n=1 Tax=Romanomermis culicivorax TaxID=13658 RepID=A0A915IH37_ROMCU
MMEALQLVIDGTMQQINFAQPIDLLPPAAAVQPVQIMPAASHGYLRDISYDFPELTTDGMGKFPDFEHQIMLMDNAIPIA